MDRDSLILECDRLSQLVDSVEFERLRWARTEGPMLARMVSLVTSALGERAEFELSEEGATTHLKRFVLKIHAKRVMAIKIYVEGGLCWIDAEAIDRSPFGVREGGALSTPLDDLDETWTAGALRQLFCRIGA